LALSIIVATWKSVEYCSLVLSERHRIEVTYTLRICYNN
jgi:hypothetical protein